MPPSDGLFATVGLNDDEPNPFRDDALAAGTISDEESPFRDELVAETPLERFARLHPVDYALYMAAIEEEGTAPTEMHKFFEIDDMDKCAYVVRLMGEAESELAGAQAEAAAEIARVTKHQQAKVREKQREVDKLRFRFLWPLREFARPIIDKMNIGKKNPVASLKTGQGRLQFTTKKATIEIYDDDLALHYAFKWQIEDAINTKITTTIKKDAMKKLAQGLIELGMELPDGVHITDPSEKFDVVF